MVTQSDLLSRGYFPRELPPPFQTTTFASAVESNRANLPQGFTGGNVAARMAFHNLARAGTLRRRLGIPNPVPQSALCDLVASKWSDLESHTRASKLSKSYPIPGPASGRALIPCRAHGELLTPRAYERANYRYILKADISLFYHSIYTHSISWAIHGKAYAKAHQRGATLGNRIDKHIRNAQDRQTMGIPVGPDTSLVVAEAILSAVDQSLCSSGLDVHGFRHVDDYELGFKSLSDAESCQALLQEILSEYELTLNPRKTAITDRPTELEPSWTLTLRRFELRPRGQGQASDIIAYFETAFSLAQEDPEAHVLKYAMGRLRGLEIDPPNWPLFHALLIQCLAKEPGAVVQILGRLIHHHGAGYPLDFDTLQNVMNSQITHHARFGHGSEVAWALWTMIVFDLEIDSDAASAVSNMPDSIVALLALHARDRGLVPVGLNDSHWQSYMKSKALYEEQWLLSYEANIQGWLPSVGGVDHVDSDPNFGFLKRLDVSFYDRSRTTAAMVPTGVAPTAGTAPQFVLSASEYDPDDLPDPNGNLGDNDSPIREGSIDDGDE